MSSGAPSTGDIVHLRTRHHVVENVSPGPHGTVVDLACMDDDAQGSSLSAIWELELDGKVVTRQAWESIGSKGFDPRESFAAFYNTLRWHCVTATDPRILQSPFRAGIRLDVSASQLVKLLREHPAALVRVNEQRKAMGERPLR